MSKEIRFHEILKKLREKHKMTQTELAETIGVDQTAISKYERGKGFPEVEKLIRLSERFDIDLDTLIFSTGFTRNELEFMDEARKKISVDELKANYELIIDDDIPATDEEIEQAIKFIKFQRSLNSD